MLTDRSTCPINKTVEMLGDRWSLLILRDLAMLEHRTFRSLLTGSQEGISPSTLSSRLRDLEKRGLITKKAAPIGHQGGYALTESGVQFVPLLFELARVGSLLDPTCEVTAPGVDDLYDDHDAIRTFTDGIRQREAQVREARVREARVREARVREARVREARVREARVREQAPKAGPS